MIHARLSSSTALTNQSQRISRWWTPRLRSFYAIVLMCGCVFAVYFPIRDEGFPAGAKSMLMGMDYAQLHVRRIRYAREALFGPGHYLPAWYTRELGGTPFWSNMQSFPLIPSRLACWLLMAILQIGPEELYVFAVQISAITSALFMFLYCRKIGVGHVGSTVAGWTFACSGFFASRVMAGHLPLLEAYCGLPLLLWLVEVNLQSSVNDRFAPFKLFAAGIAACSIALAGHPQLPVYTFFVTALYILWRARNRNGLFVGAAMILGIGLASFALYPMLLLIGRSTRILPLNPAPNDLAFPYSRLLAFLFPWADGYPEMVRMSPRREFEGYGNIAYFWDTVCYVGWLPIVSCAALGARAVIYGKRPKSAWVFLALLGVLALLLSLPAWQSVMQHIPGTILRSPARQIYLTTFALAIAAGAAIDVCLKWALARRASAVLASIAVALAVAAHVFDLGYHDRAFVKALPILEDPNHAQQDLFAQQVNKQRIGIDCVLPMPYNRELDDVGVFDSILLAKPYRAIMELNMASPGANVQNIDAVDLLPRTNQFFGVSRILTRRTRDDMRDLLKIAGLHLYEVPNPLPRAALFATAATQYLSDQEIHQHLQQADFDPFHQLLVPAGSPKPPVGAASTAPPSLTYDHPSTDEFVARLNAPWPGYLRLLETWDPGWRATVDGAAAPVICAYDTFVAIPIPAGSHEVRLVYHTPGTMVGLTMSGVCASLLIGLCFSGALRRAIAKS